MFCVIQQIQRKKPDKLGEPKEIIAYQNQWRLDESKPYTWAWMYSEERFEREHLEAFKITLHQSYRQDGKVRKRQYTVCTMSYYDICESWWGDCIVGGEKALTEKVGVDAAELCEIIDAKLEPLRERLTAEFHQSAEYAAKQEHERIRADYFTARSQFCRKYAADNEDYDRCFDVFGTLRNKEYLKQIQAEYKARKQAEREARKQSRESWRSYQESWNGTYGSRSSGGYSASLCSTYTDDERAILKKFYKELSKIYHPDLNPDTDTTAQMQLLNKLKEAWGV